MAQKNSHEVNKVLKNATKATKYTAKQIFSDKTPFISGTASATLDAMRDIKEWGRQNNPFKATNGNKDPLIRQVINTTKRGMKDAKKDLMSGDLTFKRLNKTFRSFVGSDDMFGDLDFDLDLNFEAFDNYDIVDGDDEGGGNTTAAAIIGMGESLSNDFTQTQMASTSATIGAIEASTNRITSSSATITSAAVDRIVATNMMTTTRLSTQLGQVHGSIDTINQNLLSIVEHNNEMTKFISQSQTYMEHTEQTLNDIKSLLSEMSSIGKKEESYSITNKPDFLDGRFDIKKYMKFVFNDSAMGVPLNIGMATAFKALKLTMPSFIDSSFAMPLSDILPLKTMTEKLLPALGRIGDLDKTVSNAMEIFFSKMSKGEYGGIFNMLGMFGMGVDRFNKTRYRSDGYEKGAVVWNGKSERALQEVIPDYLSNMEEYLRIIAGNTGGFDPDNKQFKLDHSRNRRIYDYAEGEFISNEAVLKKVQKNITDAVQGAFYDTYDKIGKLMNGTTEGNEEMTKFLQEIMKDEDRELGKVDQAKFLNIVHKYRKNEEITPEMAGAIFGELATARGEAVRESGKVKRQISSREMVGSSWGELINEISAQVKYDSKEGLEEYKLSQMTEKEKEEYKKKKSQKEYSEKTQGWISEKMFGQKDEITGLYSGTSLSDLRNKYADFQKHGTGLSKMIDYANVYLQNVAMSFAHGANPFRRPGESLETHAYGTNSLPRPGIFVGNTGERIESIPMKQRVDNFVNLAEAFGQEARDIRIQLASMGKDRNMGSIGFADGINSLPESSMLSLPTETGVGVNSLGKNNQYDVFTRKVKPSKPKSTGNKEVDKYRQQIDDDGKPKTEMERYIQNIDRIAQNTAITAAASVREADADVANNQKAIQSQLSKDIFGEKDENGFYKGKFASDFANMGVDFKNMINHAIDGKGYTTSAGVKIADSKESLKDKFNSLGDKAMQTVFGKDYKDKKFFKSSSGIMKNFKTGLSAAYNEEDIPSSTEWKEIDIELMQKEDNIKQRHRDGMSDKDIAEEFGIDEATVHDIVTGVFDNMFGGSSPEEVNKSMTEAQNETNKEAMKMHGKFLTGIKGGLIGLGAGMVGAGVHGVIPSLLLPGGPIGGAVLGVSAALLSKNDKFMNWMFGETDGDGNRIGGVISKDLQDKFKSFGSKILGPSVIGAAGGLIFPKIVSKVLGPVGGAFLGGGPIGGALLGVGASLLMRSKAMNNLWFGEDGDGGLKKTLGDAKKKAGDFIKSHSKNLIGIGIGAGAGALLGTGLIGATLAPAVVGATVGLASSSNSFTDFLLGTKRAKRDKDGDIIGYERDGDGLLGKTVRMVSLNIFTPLKRFAKTSSASVAEWFRHDILWEFKSMFSPFREATNDLAETFKELTEGATKVLKKVFNPLIKLGTSLGKAITKLFTGAVKGGAKIAGGAIAAPFKILGGIGRAITGKMDRTREAKIDFRYGGGTYDGDVKWEKQRGLKRIFNPLGRVAERGINTARHAAMGVAEFATGRGNGAFAKASLLNTFGQGVKAYKKTNGGAFEKLNAFGSAINPFNVFDRERQKYAEDHNLTGNAAFMNPKERRRHKKKAHEIKLDDREMRKIEKKTQKWAKQDGYNDKVELTDKEFKKRKNYFSRMGYKVDDIKNSSQLLELMYDPFGRKTKDKIEKDTKQDKAEDATIESKGILENIQDALERMFTFLQTGKAPLTEQRKEYIRDLLNNDDRRTPEDIERDFGISKDDVQKVIDEDDVKAQDAEEKENKRAARRKHLLGVVRGTNDDDPNARQARGMDKFMDNAIDKMAGITSKVVYSPALGIGKLKDKLQGVDAVTRKNIIIDISSGMSEKDIADKYGVSVRTVKRIISEEKIRNTRDINTGAMEQRLKKAKTNSNDPDGEGEEETPFVNAVMTDEDGKPVFGKKSFLGKIFGSKGALATIGTVAIAAGATALLIKFPEIIDFAKNTLWPLLRDVVWPTLKTLLTGIGAAVLGVGKVIKSGGNAVQGFMNFCSTGTWKTFEEEEAENKKAADNGLTNEKVEKEYLKGNGIYESVGKTTRDKLTREDIFTAAYIFMGNKAMLDGDAQGSVTSSFLKEYIEEHPIITQRSINSIGSSHGFVTGGLGSVVGIGGMTPTKKEKEAALERAASYINGDYGQYRYAIDYASLADIAAVDNQGASVGQGIGYGHFMQTDPRWANRKYSKVGNGKYTTMANGGCGPTALANVASQYGIRTNPMATASMAQRFGYTADGGSSASLFTSGARRLGLNSKAIGAGSIRKALSSGNKVVFAGKGRGNGLYTNVGHILSARGLDKNGNAVVDDPMRRGPISVPISRIGNGITHAWSIGRGQDETETDKQTPTEEYLEYNGEKVSLDTLAQYMLSMTKADTLGDNGINYLGSNNRAFIYYQQNPKWADVVSPRFGKTIGSAGCVESAFGSMIASITGLNYRPDLFVTKFPLQTDLRLMLQNALPPSLSGATSHRFGIDGPGAVRTNSTSSKYDNIDSLNLNDIYKRWKRNGGVGAQLFGESSFTNDESWILNGITGDYPFVIYGGESFGTKGVRPERDVFEKGYPSDKPVYESHALVAFPSWDGKNYRYHIFNPGTQQIELQGKEWSFDDLFNRKQGIESIFFLRNLPKYSFQQSGTTNNAGLIDIEDAKWLMKDQPIDKIMETAQNAKITPSSIPNGEVTTEDEENKDETLLGTVGRLLGELGKILWGNMKSIFSKDHRYESVYSDKVHTNGTFTREGVTDSSFNQSYNFGRAETTLKSMGTMQDSINKYSRTYNIPKEALRDQAFMSYLNSLGGYHDNGDGTITIESSVEERNYAGRYNSGSSNGNIDLIMSNVKSKLPNYKYPADYNSLPNWARDQINTGTIGEYSLSNKTFSNSDIDKMLKISAVLTKYGETGATEDNRSYSTAAVDTNRRPAIGINQFNGAFNVAKEVIDRMKAAPGEYALSDEDNQVADDLIRKTLTDYPKGSIFSKLPEFTEFLDRNINNTKKVQDAMVQQLATQAFANILPFYDKGILTDPKALLMYSQIFGVSPNGSMQRVVDGLNSGKYHFDSNNQLGSMTNIIHKEVGSLYNNRLKNAFKAMTNASDTETTAAVGFGGGIQDSYYSSYPTIVDTPVAINSKQKVEVEIPVINNRLDIIISYLRDLVVIARNRPVGSTALTAATNLDIGHGLANDQKLQNAGVQRKEVLPIYTENPGKPDRLKSIHDRISRSPRPI